MAVTNHLKNTLGLNGTGPDELPEGMPVLEGTPAPGTFPIGEKELVALAKKVLYETKNGTTDPSILSDDFRFEFPIIKIDKKQYLKALATFKFEETFPDLQQAAYGWFRDPYEQNRVWYLVRSTGTHRRPLNLGSVKFQPTGKTFRTPPQIFSYVFNSQGKVTSFTGGYVADNRVGNSGGLGGLFGIMVGVGLPFPGSLRFFLYAFFIKITDIVNLFTLGLANKVLKRE